MDAPPTIPPTPPSPPLLHDIPRVPTRATFDALVQRRQPVILSFSAPQAAAWSDQVIRGLRERQLPACFLEGRRSAAAPSPYTSYYTQMRSFMTARFRRKQTLKECEASGRRWIVSGIDLETPQGLDVLDALDGLMPSGCTTDATGCWLSSAGCDTSLHFDAFNPDNFHLVTCGEKDIVLFPPEEAEKLYCFGGPRYMTRFAAAVDPFRPDMARFPLYGSTTSGLRATLHAGDVIFIPALYWHALVHVGALNLSLTRWYYAPAEAQPALPSIAPRVHLNGVRLLLFEPLRDAVCAACRSAQLGGLLLALLAAFFVASSPPDFSILPVRTMLMSS